MSPGSTDPAVLFDAVERRYSGGTPLAVLALRGASFTIEPGLVVAVVGPSGSGKSTLLNLMGALDRPDAGRVLLGGQDLAQLSDAGLTRLRRDHIGFVFQFFNLVPSLSALENVQLPALLAGDPPQQAKERALAALAQVGLSARQRHHPDALSGGEMQRVAIARALARDPKLLLADEPTGNLDSQAGAEVLELLMGAAEQRRTVVIVTHDPRVAERADRVLTLRDGQIVSDVKTNRPATP